MKEIISRKGSCCSDPIRDGAETETSSREYIEMIRDSLTSMGIAFFFPDAVFSHPVCFLSLVERCLCLEGKIGEFASKLLPGVSKALGNVFDLGEHPPGAILDYARLLRESINSELPPTSEEGEEEFSSVFARELDNCMWRIVADEIGDLFGEREEKK